MTHKKEESFIKPFKILFTFLAFCLVVPFTVLAEELPKTESASVMAMTSVSSEGGTLVSAGEELRLPDGAVIALPEDASYHILVIDVTEDDEALAYVKSKLPSEQEIRYCWYFLFLKNGEEFLPENTVGVPFAPPSDTAAYRASVIVDHTLSSAEFLAGEDGNELQLKRSSFLIYSFEISGDPPVPPTGEQLFPLLFASFMVSLCALYLLWLYRRRRKRV